MKITSEKSSSVWFIVATLFQSNFFIRAMLAGFCCWSGPASRKKLGNRFLSDRIGDEDA